MNQDRRTILLVGPGAVGGTVAAWLADAGHDVTLGVRTPVERLCVLTPSGPLEARLRNVARAEEAGQPEWVLIATKAYDVEGAAAWIAPLAAGGGRFAILQNGVEHVSRFEAIVARERIVPVMVDIPAEREAPGRIRQRGPGVMQVPAGAEGRAFASLFEGTALQVSEVEDFTSALWRKLCLNVAGAVPVLTDEPAAVAWREPAAALMRALVEECVAVGRAEGARLEDNLPETIVRHYRQ